jgi:hypothetical protein
MESDYCAARHGGQCQREECITMHLSFVDYYCVLEKKNREQDHKRKTNARDQTAKLKAVLVISTNLP